MSTRGKHWKVPIRAVAPSRMVAVADVYPCRRCAEPCTQKHGLCRPCAEKKRKADKLVLHTDVSKQWCAWDFDY